MIQNKFLCYNTIQKMFESISEYFAEKFLLIRAYIFKIKFFCADELQNTSEWRI